MEVCKYFLVYFTQVNVPMQFLMNYYIMNVYEAMYRVRRESIS